MRGNRTITLTCFVMSAGLAGCDTADRQQVLLFASDTKVALDVSADPEGKPSFTLGYRRDELIWLPLASEKGEFEAENGGNQKDAYSVIASFGFDSGGQDAKISQFMATGFAARALAESGGAALVNPESVSPAVAKIREMEQSDIDLIVRHVTKDAQIQKGVFGALVDKTTMVSGRKTQLKKDAEGKTPDQLRGVLSQPSYSPFLRELTNGISS